MVIADFLATVHLLGYILAKIGNLHQLWLIWQSKKNNPHRTGKNTEQISLIYRVNGTFFFLFNIFWALSLENLDWVVLLTRSISLIMALSILWELWLDRSDKIAKYCLILCLIIMMISSYIITFYFASLKIFNSFFGWVTVLLAFTSIGGYLDRTYQIIRAKSPGKQSLIESILHLSKDLSGIVYGLFLGFNQSWPLVISLFLLAAVRTFNIRIYLYYQQQQEIESSRCALRSTS